MLRFALLLSPTLLMGCPTDTVLAPARSHVMSATGDEVNLHFQPVDLVEGDAITADLGAIRLQSVARRSEHHVSLTSDGRAIQALTGLLDGEVQLSSKPSSDGGQTSVGPTSVHRRLTCTPDGDCMEVVEYDYDLHNSDGEGTARWRTPDGRSATIDRLRYQLDAEPGLSASRVRLITPEPAILARASHAAH